jgi:hypothetical protein
LYAAGGDIDLRHVTVTGNTAARGAGGEEGHSWRAALKEPDGSPGNGEGGALYIDAAASVSLDPFTHKNVSSNSASTSHRNIEGAYTISP